MTAPTENSVSSSKARPISLQPERQALGGKPGRNRDAGQPRHVHGHGEDVVQIHLDRIGRALLAKPEGGGRRRRRQDRIDPCRRPSRNRA